MNKYLVWALAVLSVWGCGVGSADRETGTIQQASTAVGAQERECDDHECTKPPYIIPPQATDPHIDTFLDPHYVWPPATDPINRLLVFMPGANSKPGLYQLIAATAAKQGYHVIGLMYPNSPALAALCNPLPNQAREACYLNVRLETIDGIDRTNLISVNGANSIYNRLFALLVYLHSQYPNEHWSQFFSPRGLRWDDIAVGGHSNGGGMATMLAKLHAVPRVVIVSSPSDGVRGVAAQWVGIDQTPSDRIFGLVHQREPNTAVIQANMIALGLAAFGPIVLQDLSSPPYNHTHRLMTNLLPSTGKFGADAHPSTAADAFTPILPDGTPALQNAWRYIQGPSDEQEPGQTSVAERRYIQGPSDEQEPGQTSVAEPLLERGR